MPLQIYYKRIFQLQCTSGVRNLCFFVRLTAYNNQQQGLNFFESEISKFQSLNYFCNTQPLSLVQDQQSQIFIFI